MRMILALILGLLLCLCLPNNAVYAQHHVCGDDICEGGEDCGNCASDCGLCSTGDDDTDDDTDDSTGDDDQTGDDDTAPTTMEEQLKMEQLKIKRTSDFSLKGGAIDDLRIIWP